MANPSSAPIRFGVGYVAEEPVTELVRRAQWLDTTALDQLWIADERFHRDPWIVLARLAVATQRLRLATGVTDPFIRHPALTANAIATLDELADGRAILGMGAGVSGFAALGIERHQPAKALREAITVIRSLMTGKEVNFSGEAFTVKGARLGWEPSRAVPINVAGRGPRIIELAGELADGAVIATFVSGPGYDNAMRHLNKGLARRSSDVGDCAKISWVYTCVDANRDEARKAVRKGVAVALWGSLPILDKFDLDLPAGLLDYMRSRPYSYAPSVLGPAMEMLPDRILDDLSIAGPPEYCASKFRSLAESGMHEIVIFPFAVAGRPIDDTVRLFVEEVIPLVHDMRSDA